MNTHQALGRLAEVVRLKHLALAAERAYCAWLRPLHLPRNGFLTVLAGDYFAASTQNQAF